AAAAAALVLTLFNPFFDPRIAITTYTDTPTGLLLAGAVFALWRGGTTDQAAARGDWYWWAGLVFAALAQLRETNIALIGGLSALALVPTLVAAAAAPDNKFGAVMRAALSDGLRLLGPAAAALILWRLHLAAEGIGPDMAPRPWADWDWSAPLVVLRVLLLDRLGNNLLFGGIALAAALLLPIAAALAWRRCSPAVRWLLALVAGLGLGQTALLTFAYTAVFTREEVEAAASAWRYAGQLGPAALLATAVVIGGVRFGGIGEARLPRGLRQSAKTSIFWPIGVIAVVFAAQAAGRDRWRLECSYGGTVAMAVLSDKLLAPLPPAAVVGISHPTDSPLVRVLVRLVRARHSGSFGEPAVTPLPPGGVEPPPVDATLDLSAIPVGRIDGPVAATLTMMDGRKIAAEAAPAAYCR
ncbi:MAG TPA: hypothetical protein PKZ97_16230, partial [Azospirillaceae bacterium]|nr:hypothetical protein [Azospirillaceae bacterium]